MRVCNLGVAGVVAGVILFGSVGSVSAIEPFDLNSVSLQYQREVRSTYIIQFPDNIAPSEVQGRANAIAARFQGRIRHTYTRALSGFAIRMNSTAMARLMVEDDLGISRVSRGVIMTIAQSSGNAVTPTKGKPVDSGGGGNGGGGGSSCDQEIGWNILRVTTMEQTDCSVSATSGLADYTPADGLTLPTVCVIDTGLPETHEDLNIASRYGTISGSDAVLDGHGHGTHVAGIIGARANDLGVVGVAPGVPVTSIKVLNDEGFGADFDVIAGIDQALAVSCDIVNMSLGGDASIALDTAVKNASSGITTSGCGYANGCLDNSDSSSNIIFTLAAGNSAKDIKDYSPARASIGENDNIFTIASFGQERKTTADLWSSFSNFGQPYDNDGTVSMVDFALPGGKILSTIPGGYDTYNGTSMAAPHMAGLLVRYIVAGKGTISDNRLSVNNDVFTLGGSVHQISKVGRLIISDGGDYDIPID